MSYIVGDKVEKCSGDYKLQGIVRAVFTTYEGGPLRYVVAHELASQGGEGYICHIYAPSNLRLAE